MSQCLKITENVSFKNGLGKSEVCGQTVLPDRSLLIEQRLVKNKKRFFFGEVQTLCNCCKSPKKVSYRKYLNFFGFLVGFFSGGLC